MIRFFTNKKHKKNTRHQKVSKAQRQFYTVFFFMIRFYTHKTTKRKQGTKKHSKYKNITKQKHKNAKK